MRRFLGRFKRSDSGQALIEFAVFSSVFILFVIGATDVSYFILASMIVQEGATEGANYGSAPGNQNDIGGMELWANQASYGVALNGIPTATTFFTCTPGGSPVSSNSSCGGGAAPMEYVKVTSTASINPLFKTSLFGTMTVTGTAIYRVAWKTQ